MVLLFIIDSKSKNKNKNAGVIKGRALMLRQGELIPLASIKLVFEHKNTLLYSSTFTDADGDFTILLPKGYGVYRITLPYLDDRLMEALIFEDYWEVIVEDDEGPVGERPES